MLVFNNVLLKIVLLLDKIHCWNQTTSAFFVFDWEMWVYRVEFTVQSTIICDFNECF